MDILWWILAALVWIAIAFWPARVASRKGPQLLRVLHLQPVLLPGPADRRLRRARSRYLAPQAAAGG
jgi:hypothetical protein